MNIPRRDLLKYTAGAGLLQASPALAAPCLPRTDDLWFINTAGVPCGLLSPAHHRCFSALRMNANHQWQNSSLDQLFADSGDGRITIFFVHGHRVNVDWAMRSGWEIYRGLVQACPVSPPPIRFVIWKWPSEGGLLRNGRRPIVDARDKAVIADHQAYKLAWLMGHLPSQSPLSLMGFSLGPRIITGALHLTAGGSQLGYTVASPYQAPVRAALWAPAIDHHWLAAGHRHGRAIYASDAMLNLYNSCDPVLKSYPRLDRSTRNEALGKVGMPASWLGAYAGRYRQRDMCGQINHLHLTRNYSGNATAMVPTRQNVLWHAV